MNDRLRPLPSVGEPSDAVSSVPTSLSDSSNSYNGDDARRFLWEWRAAQNRYSEATWENGQLEIHLGASQAALHAAEEEASAVRARLAESDAVVTGKMIFRDVSISISHCLYLDRSPFSVIISPDDAVGVSPTGGERGC